MIIHIQVKPASKTNVLSKDAEGKWMMKVKAPPVDGKANEEVIRFLSEVLKIPKSSVLIASGYTSKFKKIEINGLSDDDIRTKLETHLQSTAG